MAFGFLGMCVSIEPMLGIQMKNSRSLHSAMLRSG
jgi:hypothetical protein